MNYKKILDELPFLIYVTKGDGATAIFYNKGWQDYTGFTEALPMWHNVVDPRDSERVKKVINDAVLKEEGYELEVRLKCAHSGEYRWFLSKANPVNDGDTHIYIGVSIDIHERKALVKDVAAGYERVAAERVEKIKELEEKLKNV